MKSRQRPPLNLTEPEPVAAEADASAKAMEPREDTAAEDLGGPLAPERPVSEPAAPERPMSERRRRRLQEQQRALQEPMTAPEPEPEPAAAAEPLASQASNTPEPEPELVMPRMSVSADAPPVAYAPPPSPTADAPSSVPSATPLAPVAGASRSTYVIAALASVMWIGGIASWAAFEAGSGGAAFDGLRIALYALIALAPAGLAIMLAHAVRQGAGLAAETVRARGFAEALVAPTAHAAHQTGQQLISLRNDIDQATLAAEQARTEMVLLRESLALETDRLGEACETAARTARHVVEQIAGERENMRLLGASLDTQSAAVLDAVERQSRMIVDASDLAQTQLREAEAALAARAADLAAAAGDAQDAARLAADDLARQTLRLENAGAGVAEQIQSVEEGLGQQRAALVTAAYTLRTDQEDFSAQVESQRAQLTEQLDAARSATTDLGQTATKSADSMRDLVEAASDQFRALVDMSQREADGFDAATKVSLDRFEALANEAREAVVEETRLALAALRTTAEDSRALAAEASSQAQVRADRLGEALFDAAQKADHAADTRIENARRIVGETVVLVDEAGEQAISRLETTMERMIQALSQVDASIADLDDRTSRLPDEARERAEAVRRTVEEGLAALGEASRKAAEDTEALEQGFQERVRRNYDMLTEAVRMMGVVSGESPTSRRREGGITLTPPTQDEPRARRAPPKDDGFGLRGRLRLEPTGGEAPRAPAPAGGLDWADLVGDEPEPAPLDLDQPVMPADAEALADRITAAIRRMGVDPNALLPRQRVEEAAQAFADRDPDHARQIVRRVAPAAVRSVSRRVMSDAELRSDAERYVRAFAQTLADQGRGGDAASVLSILATDAGRAFMLLDAAVGDLS